MGPGEKKKGFAETFSEAFEKAMREEHKEYEAMEPKYDPDKCLVDVVEPEGEKHFDV